MQDVVERIPLCESFQEVDDAWALGRFCVTGEALIQSAGVESVPCDI